MQIIEYTRDPRVLDTLIDRRKEPPVEVRDRVRSILDAVEKEGDEAVTNFTRMYDCKFIDSLGLRVSSRDVEAGYAAVGKPFLKALQVAKRNIERFHRRQLPSSWSVKAEGLTLRQVVAPLSRVGIYVPGGKAAYPSTVLMNAIPARVAGVKEIVMATPCNAEGKIRPEVLVAAAECGVEEIYRIGGAQAIGALAFGTESIRRVDKITGPGNAYVAAAKQLVFGRVGIDMIAGPTELVVIADGSAAPDVVAADLIAQAEHDEAASPMCVVTSRGLAERIVHEVEVRVEAEPRRAIAQRALDGQGWVVVVKDVRQAIDVVNAIAPEHVEIMARRAAAIARRIVNAGAIFVGGYSAEALGDYAAGPNHTLPTQGSARFSSPLGIQDFMKVTNVIAATRKGFLRIASPTEILAVAEGLHGHAESVRVRRHSK